MNAQAAKKNSNTDVFENNNIVQKSISIQYVIMGVQKHTLEAWFCVPCAGHNVNVTIV